MNPRELIRASRLVKHEGERLLMAATGLTRSMLLDETDLDQVAVRRFEAMVLRRRAGEPLQYIEELVPFGPITLGTDPRALIPRPETEAVWDEARRMLGDAGPGTVIVDLGTGTGALALALKSVFPEARVIATDVSEEALALAKENADRLGLTVDLLHGDLFEALPASIEGRIDLLVSNPPYVSEAEWEVLPAEIAEYEPRSALVAGPAGTEVLDRIADESYWWLGVGGWVICEIGETQGSHVAGVFGQWLDVEVRPDLAGKDRILVGRKGARCCV